jgi:hypothetical protein
MMEQASSRGAPTVQSVSRATQHAPDNGARHVNNTAGAHATEWYKTTHTWWLWGHPPNPDPIPRDQTNQQTQQLNTIRCCRKATVASLHWSIQGALAGHTLQTACAIAILVQSHVARSCHITCRSAQSIPSRPLRHNTLQAPSSQPCHPRPPAPLSVVRLLQAPLRHQASRCTAAGCNSWARYTAANALSHTYYPCSVVLRNQKVFDFCSTQVLQLHWSEFTPAAARCGAELLPPAPAQA